MKRIIGFLLTVIILVTCSMSAVYAQMDHVDSVFKCVDNNWALGNDYTSTSVKIRLGEDAGDWFERTVSYGAISWVTISGTKYYSSSVIPSKSTYDRSLYTSVASPKADKYTLYSYNYYTVYDVSSSLNLALGLNLVEGQTKSYTNS